MRRDFLPRLHAELMELMTRFHVMAQEQGIAYGIEGGTLLGAVREAGIIAHDDDIDVYVLEEGADAVRAACARYGLQCTEADCGWRGLKLYAIEEGPVDPRRREECPFIDVFVRARRGAWYVSEGMFADQRIAAAAVESPAVYRLGELLVWGPSRAAAPGGYLEAVYGADWRVPRDDGGHVRRLRPACTNRIRFRGLEADQRALARLRTGAPARAPTGPARAPGWAAAGALAVAWALLLVRAAIDPCVHLVSGTRRAVPAELSVRPRGAGDACDRTCPQNHAADGIIAARHGQGNDYGCTARSLSSGPSDPPPKL